MPPSFHLSQDTLHYMMREVQSTEVMQPGIGGVKPISWSGIRHMISEVSLSVHLFVHLSVHLSVCLDKIFMVTIIGQGLVRVMSSLNSDVITRVHVMSSLDSMKSITHDITTQRKGQKLVPADQNCNWQRGNIFSNLKWSGEPFLEGKIGPRDQLSHDSTSFHRCTMAPLSQTRQMPLCLVH